MGARMGFKRGAREVTGKSNINVEQSRTVEHWLFHLPYEVGTKRNRLTP